MSTNTVALSYTVWRREKKYGTGVKNGFRVRLYSDERSQILIYFYYFFFFKSIIQFICPDFQFNVNAKKRRQSFQVQVRNECWGSFFWMNWNKMCSKKKRRLFYQSRRDRKLTAERNKTYTDREPAVFVPPLASPGFVRTHCVNVLVSSKGIGAAHVGKGD